MEDAVSRHPSPEVGAVPPQAFTGLPTELLINCVPDTVVKLAVAVDTSDAFVVYAGGGPPEPCPLDGIVQVANVTGVVQEAGTAGGEGAVLTVRLSVAKLPVSREPIKRWAEVLLYVPVTGTVTFTLIVQLLFGESVPFENERDAAPAVGAKVGDPQPEVEAAGVLATVIAPGDVGKVSVKFNPVIVPLVGFVKVKVSVEMPLTLAGSGLKFFAIVTEDGLRMFAMRVDTPKSAL
jgi:hypothetical protein